MGKMTRKPAIPADGPLLRISLTAPEAVSRPIAGKTSVFDREVDAARVRDAERAKQAAIEAAEARRRGALLSGFYRIEDPTLRRAFLKRHRSALFAANA